MMGATGSLRRGLLVAAGLGVALGLAYLVEALSYPRGTAAQPGPGLYPLLVGALLVAGAVGTGLDAHLSRLAGEVAWPGGAGRLRVAAIVAVCLGYVLALPYVGHPLAGTLVALAALHLMGLSSWPPKIALAVVLGLGSHYLFAGLLGVPLPAGPWFGRG